MRTTDLELHRKRINQVNSLRKKGYTMSEAVKKLKIYPNQYYMALKVVGKRKEPKFTIEQALDHFDEGLERLQALRKDLAKFFN